jgi:hypothetical protein
MGGQRAFPVKGTVKVGDVVGFTTDGNKTLSMRLEAFRTAFSCVRRRDKFLVSPETFSTGDRVFSTGTCMLPFNDKL